MLACLLAPMGPGARAQAEDRVATILVQGLERIDRERLLEDLHLQEGDLYEEGLERKLEARALHLPYLRTLRAESQPGRIFAAAPLAGVDLFDGNLAAAKGLPQGACLASALL